MGGPWKRPNCATEAKKLRQGPRRRWTGGRSWCLSAAPFEAVVDALGVPREADRRPLVSVLFMLQNAPGTDRIDLALAPGVATEALTAPDPVCRFELVLSLRLSAAGVQGFVRYATDLFDRATAERVGRRFAALLPRVLADADAALLAPPGVFPGPGEASA